MENIDMALGMNRLRSFTSWSYTDCPKPLALAVAGFYYTGEGDKTRCFSCEGEVSDWKPDMHPHVIHRARFPNCRLVKGKETQDRPISTSQENSSEQTSSFDNTTVKQRVNVQGMTNSVTVMPGETQRNLLPGVGRESSSSVVPVVNNKDMRYEEARLESYSHWPKSDMVRPSDLAKAGMYFIGPGDRVKCAFCKGKLEGWMQDNPLEEHRKHFGIRCRFVQGAQVGNVPISQGKAKPHAHFPDYGDVQRRLESFHDWKHTSQQPHDLAAAGFFYTGDGDTVRCYFCGGTLHDWRPSDDPWLEHAHWFPRCGHVTQVNGPEYTEAGVLSLGDPANVSSASSSGWSVDVIMASEAAQTLLELGLLRVDVEKAARVWASRNNERMPDANSLAELVMKIKNGEDQNLPCRKCPSPPSSLVPTVSSPVAQIVTFPEAIIKKGTTPQSKNYKQKAQYQKHAYPFQQDLKELSETNFTEDEDTAVNENVPISWLLDTIMASEAAQEVLDTGLTRASVLRAAHFWARKNKRMPDANILALLAMNFDNSGRDDQGSPRGDSGPSSSKSLASNVTSHEHRANTTPQVSNEVQQLRREVAELKELTLCKVCLDQRINVAFLPCGHLVCCEICSQAVTQCPICRVPKMDNNSRPSS